MIFRKDFDTTFFALVLSFLLFPRESFSQYCEQPAAGIADNATVQRTISVNGTTGVIADLNVRISIDHSWIGDLSIEVESPLGTKVILFFAGCNTSANQNIRTLFDDSGSALQCPPSGFAAAIPFEALSVFNVETMNGSWILRISDNQADHGGVLNEWCLEPTLTNCPNNCDDNNTCTIDECIADNCYHTGICPLENDFCQNASVIAPGNDIPFSNLAATTDGLPDALCLNGGSNQIYEDVWYKLTAPCSNSITVSTVGGAVLDTRIAVYQSGCNGALLACNDDFGGMQQSSVTWNATANEIYLIRIGTYSAGEHGTGTFDVVADCSVYHFRIHRHRKGHAHNRRYRNSFWLRE